MAPAVANDKLLGYKALYKTLLEDSKRGMAMAIRPFVDADNYPILVHCIHGKDRTGLIIMLLLMLCDVDQEVLLWRTIASIMLNLLQSATKFPGPSILILLYDFRQANWVSLWHYETWKLIGVARKKLQFPNSGLNLLSALMICHACNSRSVVSSI